jgi:hypothetical protein
MIPIAIGRTVVLLFQFIILPLQNLLFPVNLRFNVEVNDPDSYRENRCPFISIYNSAVAEFTLSG